MAHVEQDDDRQAEQGQQPERKQQLQPAHATNPRSCKRRSTRVSKGQSVINRR